MVTTIFENLLLEAYEQNAVTGWFGSIGCGVDNLLTARRLRDALALVSGVEITDDPDKTGANKAGIYFVWCEPKTAAASAVASLIVRNFCQLAA